MSDDTPTTAESTGPLDDTSTPLDGREPESIPELVEPPVENRTGATLFTGGLPGEGLGEAGDPARAVDAAEPVTAVPAELTAATPAPVQTVYVTAPLPPRVHGNRGVGILWAAVATVVYAVLLAVVAALYRAIAGSGGSADGFAVAFGDWLPGFVTVPLFYVPVAAFLVLFILFVVIVNRADWGVYVLGSFLLAAALYFASIGLLLALNSLVIHSAGGAGAASLAVNPAVVIATVLAREVTIWFGAVISRRGRRVSARNAEEAESFERESAQQRAELERVQYGVRS